MKVRFYCTRWGQEQVPWDEFFQRVRQEGYDGVEASLPLEPSEQEPILNGLEKHGLKLVAVHWDTVSGDFMQHARQMELRLRSMVAAKAVLITSHTGKDYFSFDENVQLLLMSKRIAQEHQIDVIHETHRGKFSFAAHVTKRYLEAIPSLRLNLDISHWFTVAESYLEDQVQAVQLAVARTAHIHARVGHKHAPQVSDPRHPEWEESLRQHLLHWDMVIDRHRQLGSRELGITCEFGPAPYMPLVPGTLKPVADQWEVNAFMRNYLKSRYDK